MWSIVCRARSLHPSTNGHSRKLRKLWTAEKRGRCCPSTKSTTSSKRYRGRTEVLKLTPARGKRTAYSRYVLCSRSSCSTRWISMSRCSSSPCWSTYPRTYWNSQEIMSNTRSTWKLRSKTCRYPWTPTKWVVLSLRATFHHLCYVWVACVFLMFASNGCFEISFVGTRTQATRLLFLP